MSFFVLFLGPILVGGVVEYLSCRLPKKKVWRYVPPLTVVAVAVLLAWLRYEGWSDTAGAPIETLLFFPGIPLLALLIGFSLGFLCWKKLWTPQIVKNRRRGR